MLNPQLPVRERSILFSGQMVPPVLADLKTQTRREVKWRGLEPGLNLRFTGLEVQRSGSNWVLASQTRTSWEYRSVPQPCPYGAPGDHLWVRETFYAFGRWETRFSEKKGRDEWHFIDMTLETGHSYCYAADGSQPALLGTRRSTGVTPAWWRRPAIFMPRAASRITFEVTDVRVERLQDISEADAKAEGISEFIGGWWCEYEDAEQIAGMTPQEGYRHLWERINGPGSWDANPWVWVIGFRRITAPMARKPEGGERGCPHCDGTGLEYPGGFHDGGPCQDCSGGVDVESRKP